MAELEPNRYGLRYLQAFLAHPEHLNYALEGTDAEIWGSVENPKGHSTDLISIFPRASEAPLVRLFKERFAFWFHTRILRLLRRKKRPDRDGLLTYDAAVLNGIVSIIANVLTFMLLYAPIVWLSLSRSHILRLLSFLLFIIMFSLCLGLFGSQQYTLAITTYVGIFHCFMLFGLADCKRFAAVLVTLLANDDDASTKG